MTNGEGWHNNHHASPRAAAHGHRWWEIDLTYWTIVALKWVGLAWKVVPVKVPKVLLPDGQVSKSNAVTVSVEDESDKGTSQLREPHGQQVVS